MESNVPVEELVDLAPVRQEEVKRWLNLHREENFLVDEDCHVIYTDSPGSRNTLALSNLLFKLVGRRPDIYFADAATFATFREISGTDSTVEIQQEETSEIINNLQYLFTTAIEQNCSDIHLRIRQQAHLLFRIHGLLFKQKSYSRRIGLYFVRTVFNYFVRSNKDFSPSAVLDGAFDFTHNKMKFGIRASLMPEVRGCTLVLRIRYHKNSIQLANAGYTDGQCQVIRRAVERSSGMVLFSGPTNSGKSTTVSNLLAEVSSERNIISIEEPVEVRLPNVTQVDLSKLSSAMTADALLGSVVRQDPDLLALAEIRDRKTAEFAENMVLQGRLVIATLHADSISAIPQRLVKLGMDEHNLYMPGFLIVLVNQTLIPALCSHCSLTTEAAAASALKQSDYTTDSKKQLRFRNPAGCRHCRSGIVGRELVAEVLNVDFESRKRIRLRNYEALYDNLNAPELPSRAQHTQQKMEAGLLDPQIARARLENQVW